MKKMMKNCFFITTAILAVLFAFTSCEENNQTGGGGESWSYTVTFDKNHNDSSGWTDANPKTKTVKNPATTVGTLPANPARSGHEFMGWLYEGAAFTETTTVTKSITVKANWYDPNQTVTLDGTASITATTHWGVGGVLTVDTKSIENAPPSGVFAYAWKADGEEIGTDSDTYTIKEEDIGKLITCVITHSIAEGSITATGKAILHNLSGTAAITGDFKVGEIVSVDITGLENVPEEGNIVYQWKAGSGNVGDSLGNYTIASGDAGKLISCVITHTSTGGSVTAAGQLVPLGLGGTATITGTYKIGSELTVDTTEIENIPDDGNFIYQWKAGNEEVGSSIATYTPTGDDAGKLITCVITHTDTSGSITATGDVVPFNIELSIHGKDTGDSVSFHASEDNASTTGKTGDTITIYYTLADTKNNNQLVLQGHGINETITTFDPGTKTYTVVADHATDGAITFFATFTHSDKTIDNIAFDSNETVEKTYGDAPFTRVTTQGSGSGAITYESSEPTVASVNPTTGEVTIHKRTTSPVTITAAKAEDASYSDASAFYQLSIHPKNVTITGVTAANKVYDGHTNAVVAGTPVVDGKVGTDTVSVVNGTAAFSDKNVGTGKTVTFAGFTLGNNDDENYHLSAQPANATANITPLKLTINNPTLDTEKEHDGNTTAEVTAGTFTNLVSGDNVTRSATATYDNANVGTGKTITVVYSIGGADAGNYTAPDNYVVNNGVITAAGTPSSALDGLWWSRPVITNTNSNPLLNNNGIPGVLVLDSPNFWHLNHWGNAQTGTFTVTGTTSGSFKATSTQKKDGTTSYQWASASASDVINATYTLSGDGNTLTVSISGYPIAVNIVYTKTDWYSEDNGVGAENNGILWQTQIGHSGLTAIIPPPPLMTYGWVGDEFKLPPSYPTQPAAEESYINANTLSYKRNVMVSFTSHVAPNTPGSYTQNTSEPVQVGRMLTINSHGMDSINTHLTARLLRDAQYVVIPFPNANATNASNGFTSNRNIITGMYSSNVSGTDGGVLWSNSAGMGSKYGLETFNLAWSGTKELYEGKGIRIDYVNKLLVIDLRLAIPGWNISPETAPAMKIYIGIASGSSATFFAHLGIAATDPVWLVNIRNDELAPQTITNFSLLTPANEATNVNNLTEFTWREAGFATSYKLEISTSDQFPGGSTTTQTVNVPKATVQLANGTTYYWRVTATASGLQDKVSEIRSYTTQAGVPDPFYKPSMAALFANNIINNTTNASLVDGGTGIRIASANTSFANLPIITQPNGTYNFQFVSLRYKLEDSGARLFLRQYETPTPADNSVGRFFLAWNGTVASGASIDLWNAVPHNATAAQGEGLLFLPYTADTYSGNNTIYTANGSVTGSGGLKAFTFFGQNATSHINLYDITFYNNSELRYDAIHTAAANTATDPETVLATVLTAMAGLTPGEYTVMFYKGPGNSANGDNQRNLYAVHRVEFINSMTQQELTAAYGALTTAGMGYMYVVYDANNRVHMAGTFRK